MRNMKLHTICILALGSILTGGFEAKAQLDPNMEASVDCSVADCMFRGNPQTRDAIAGFQKLPTTNGEMKLQKVSRYSDNMDYVVDRRVETQFAPIGELESVASTYDKNGNELKAYGSATLISPCYIITNHHVAFGDDLRPVPGKDYSMKFRVGVGPTPDTAFLGNTIATPVAWGERGACNTDDWAIMKLKTCVGARADIGWMETSRKTIQQLVGVDIAVAGFAGDHQRGELSFSTGRAMSIDPANGFLKHSASAVGGQSGGAVMVKEDGILKLAGMHTTESVDYKTNSNQFNTYSDKYSNEFISIEDIVSRPDIKMMLDQDKAAHGNQNPALTRLSRPIPSRQSAQST
jgi:V8-like Glu-specific endopeptidase